MENNIEIIHEDSDVLVINKPAGLMMHPDGRGDEKTLVDWLLSKYPSIKGIGESEDRPGIVHRIDKETSGVLIIAKTQDSFINLKEQFKEREARKEYRAFVYGEVKLDKGVIDRPIGKSSTDFRLRSAQRGARGVMREAITEYEVLNRSNGFSYMAVYPKTGRTHQIRAHFKAINYPVVCDKLYAPKRECALGFDRLALHAHRLAIVLLSGEIGEFEAPIPEDFKNALKGLNIAEV